MRLFKTNTERIENCIRSIHTHFKTCIKMTCHHDSSIFIRMDDIERRLHEQHRQDKVQGITTTLDIVHTASELFDTIIGIAVEHPRDLICGVEDECSLFVLHDLAAESGNVIRYDTRYDFISKFSINVTVLRSIRSSSLPFGDETVENVVATYRQLPETIETISSLMRLECIHTNDIDEARDYELCAYQLGHFIYSYEHCASLVCRALLC